jgi:lipid II isoglutaminyl synthase (glutamine-hydrolysing)
MPPALQDSPQAAAAAAKASVLGLFELTPKTMPAQSLSAKALLGTTLAKVAAFTIKALGKGEATSMPGKAASAVAPQLLQELAGQLPLGAFAVTGTNGKTTTAGLLAAFLAEAGYNVVHNQLGANMRNGIVTALALQTNPLGQLQGEVGVLEVDEASLPHVAPHVPVQGVLVTNLFRDQLDRYGELDTTGKLIAQSFEHAQQWVLLNADDPLVADLSKYVPATTPVLYFGLENLTWEQPLPELASVAGVPFPQEVTDCPKCGTAMAYGQTFMAHLGHYACPACGYHRPQARFKVSVQNLSAQGASLLFEDSQGHLPAFTLQSKQAGAYNLYNLAAAATVARLYDIAPQTIQAALDAYHGVFGRAERRTIHGKALQVLLIKNPAGATEVLRLVAADPKARIVIAINDDYADGRDISWLWDAAFELLQGTPPERWPVIVSGRRAQDMAVRLKYAGLPPEALLVEADLTLAVRAAVVKAKADETVYVLPTYTALLALTTLWDGV